MALLSKDDIVNADDETFLDVDVPEWGGTVRIRTISGRERENYENFGVRKRTANRGQIDVIEIRARLLSVCLVGDDGERLFSDSELGMLNTRNGAVLDRLYDKASAFNRIGGSGLDEDLGNSDSEASDGSGSASQLALA